MSEPYKFDGGGNLGEYLEAVGNVETHINNLYDQIATLTAERDALKAEIKRLKSSDAQARLERLEALENLSAGIAKWHRSIFGEYEPTDHVRAIGQKAEEEARELQEATSRIQMRLEIADGFICMLAAADRLGIDPVEAAQEKLAILIERGMSQLQRDRDRGIFQARDIAQAALGGEE